jgi:hypothetical protein
MQETISESKPGDIYLLFHDLPYDFSQELPISLGPGVCVDMTPHNILHSAEKGLSDYVLPSFNLPGTGINNCCLRCYSNIKLTENIKTENLLFLSLLSMRLHNPLKIRIAGQFLVGEADDPILEPKLYELTAPWSIGGSYNPSDFVAVEKLVQRLIEADKLELNRLITALIFFSHVTLGQVGSYQMATLGLFTSLEALFVPTGHKAQSISKRISLFLHNFNFPNGRLDEWIKSEYINTRHKLAHGIHDAAFGMKARSDRYRKFGILHDICRISLLGFLSLNDSILKTMSETNGKELQRIIDTMSPVTGETLNNYKFLAK